MNVRQQMAEELARRIPGCVAGGKFGGGSLHVGNRIFAFTRLNEGAVLKLPESRIAELVAGGSEMHLLQMGPRTMREWVVVPNIAAPENLKLLREAMAYVASLPPETRQRAKKKSAKKAAKGSTAEKSALKKAAKKVAKAPSRAARKKSNKQ